MLAEAGRDLERKRSLRQRGAVSASQLDQAKALYDQTRAQLSMAEAEVETATAQVRQQEAAVLLFRRTRSEEHTSELQSLMRISYAVFCLKQKTVTHEREK